MRRYILWIGLGLALGLGLIAAYAFTRPYTFHGSLIQDAFTAPDFTLPDSRGGDFTLSAQRGKLVMIFFGYTSCPDVCPATLSELKQLRGALGRDASRVQVVFISVDPDRDTPQKIAGYVQRFDPTFAGLTADEARLDPVWKEYGVYIQRNKASPQDIAYDVEHSSQVYLVDAAGNLRLTYSFGTPVEQMLDDVRYLLRKG